MERACTLRLHSLRWQLYGTTDVTAIRELCSIRGKRYCKVHEGITV